MNSISEILGNFYVLFIAITIFLILALIGYFIDQKHPDEEKKKKKAVNSAEELEAKLANAKGKTFSSAVNNDNVNGSINNDNNNPNI